MALRLSIILLLLFSSLYGFGYDKDSLDIQISYLNDFSHKYDQNSIQNVDPSDFTLLPKASWIHYLQTRWTKVKISNKTSEDQELFLSLDKLSLIYLLSIEVYDAQQQLPTPALPNLTQSFFSTKIPPGQSRIFYIKTLINLFSPKLTISSKKDTYILKKERTYSLLIAFGVLSFCLIYFYMLYYFTRDRIFVDYFLTTFSLSAMCLIYIGTIDQFFWEWEPSSKLFLSFVTGCFFPFLAYKGSENAIAQNSPLWSQYMRYYNLAWAFAGVLATLFCLTLIPAIGLITSNLVIVLLVIMFAALLLHSRSLYSFSSKLAKLEVLLFLLIGCSFLPQLSSGQHPDLSIAMTLLLLYVPIHLVMRHAFQIVTLSDKNKKVIQDLEAAEATRAHGYSQLAKMVYPHQLSQIQCGSEIEATMPVGSHDACVLAFDVIGSSRIKHEEFPEVLENFLSHCRDLMMEGYNGATMKSRGYMIKEMGDGFLCSIGFPFEQLGHLKTSCAVELAERIIEIFNNYMNALEYDKPIRCSIGIGKGLVRGFFSKSGAIRHDLWGAAIVKATRYESMRKIILTKDDENSSIIILQDEVYQSLSQTQKSSYEILDFYQAGIRVRDDPGAFQLAYRIISPSYE